MKAYKMVIAYDGTAYAGWQVQKNASTIAGILEKTFYKTFEKTIKLLGASRTDAGVHAHGQVARFYSDLVLSPENILRVWNEHLPNDILIKSLDRCSESFNPRYEVIDKTYFYHIFLKRPHPQYARYGLYWPHNFCEEKFKESLQLFVGQHDYRSFCTGDYETTVRSIDEIEVLYDDQMQAYKIALRGRSFLRYMIRRIIGACLKVSSSDLPLSILKKALEEKNPSQKLPTAPAQGLVLSSICYKE